MRSHKSFWVIMIAAVVTIGAAACDQGRDDAAPIDTALDRELELALQGDTTPAEFGDTAVAAEEPPVVATAPVRAMPPTRPPRPRPEPDRAEITSDIVETTAATEIVRDPEPRFRTFVVAVGTTMDLSLDTELSTKTNEPGDDFTATLQQPVYAEDGSVIIPAGASVRGRVTNVQKSGRVGETALLNIAFEAVSWGDSSYPLEATVVQAHPERVGRASTAEQVGKVAASAAAGALIGRVIGGKNKDAIKGAVVGAAAGTAIVLGTSDVDAVLKQGSLMVIRTERPLEVVVEG